MQQQAAEDVVVVLMGRGCACVVVKVIGEGDW